MSDKHAKRLRRDRRQHQQQRRPPSSAPSSAELSAGQGAILPEQRGLIARAVQRVVGDDARWRGMDPTVACEAYARVGAFVLNTLALGVGWWNPPGVPRLPYPVQVGKLVVQPGSS